MPTALLLLCVASVGGMPEPAIVLDFDAKPLPAGAKIDGKTSFEPGKRGKALRCHRAPEMEFLWESPDGTRLLTSRLGEFGRANFYMNAYLPIRYFQIPARETLH